MTLEAIFAGVARRHARIRLERAQRAEEMIQHRIDDAGVFYQLGRMDRVAGRAMAESYRWNPYYRRAYLNEQAKEIVK